MTAAVIHPEQLDAQARRLAAALDRQRLAESAVRTATETLTAAQAALSLANTDVSCAKLELCDKYVTRVRSLGAAK